MMIVGHAYTTVSVSDMKAAIAYFRDTIGMEVTGDSVVEGDTVDRLYGLNGVKARRVIMRLPVGSEIHIVQHLAHQGRPLASALRQFDIGIIHLDVVSKQIEKIFADFQKVGVVTNCPVQINERGKNRCFSFLGPDGVRLETHDWWVKHSEHTGHGSWLPEADIEKGFYAFDHTALSVGELKNTLRLYRDILELKVMAQSFLDSPRFHQMDSVPGGRAENVMVRGNEGSAIQFIHHLAHKGKGRQVASTLQQCDYAIVNIGLKTDDIEGLHKLLSKEAVAVNCAPQSMADGSRAFSFRDPDGNLLIAEG